MKPRDPSRRPPPAPLAREKLLVLTSTFPRWAGDVEPPFVFELSRRLARHFDVHVLAPHTNGALRREEMSGLTVWRYRYLPDRLETLAYRGGIAPRLRANRLSYLQVPFFLCAQLLALCSIIRGEGIRLVHAHWIIPQGLTAVLCRRLFHPSIRVLVTAHGADLFGFPGMTATALKRYVARHADRLTVVSEAMAAEARKLGTDTAPEVAPMGIDTSAFAPPPGDPKVRGAGGAPGPLILFVGRLVEKKGLRYLLAAMPAVLASIPDARLLVIGEGPLAGGLRDLVMTTGIADAVTFGGAVPQSSLPAVYASADLFVGPSITAGGGDTEGFGLVFAEAMACGTPVIASDLPSIRDVVRDGETGFLVPQKDPARLAAAIVEVLSGRRDLRSIRAAARRYVVEHLDWEVVAEAYARRLKEMRK